MAAGQPQPVRRCESEEMISPLFRKLNLGGNREIVVLNAPDSFQSELKQLKDVKIVRDPSKAKDVKFGLAFAITQAQLDRASKIFSAASEGDAVIWFAYPKGSSKRYACEFNRDSGWNVIRTAGFASVRMVAIDEDWSALRFRRVEYVKPGTGDSNRKR
jgi:hypothetical protein